MDEAVQGANGPGSRTCPPFEELAETASTTERDSTIPANDNLKQPWKTSEHLEYTQKTWTTASDPSGGSKVLRMFRGPRGDTPEPESTGS